jgi:hypothetical protein
MWWLLDLVTDILQTFLEILPILVIIAMVFLVVTGRLDLSAIFR